MISEKQPSGFRKSPQRTRSPEPKQDGESRAGGHSPAPSKNRISRKIRSQQDSTEFSRIVFITLPGGKTPVPAGLFTLDTGLGVGTFQYGRRYIERSNALPLDPVNLPLSPEKFSTQKNKGMFGIIEDVLPDSWGRFILAKQLNVPYGTIKDHELIDLISTNAVGAIAFGNMPDKVGTIRDESISLENLGEIADAFDRATNNEDLPPDLRYLLRQGTSLGGAQPKCPVKIGGEEWIAKFESSKTIIKYPGAEFATMTLAAKAGIRTPEIRLETVAGRLVYLTKRFDRERGQRLPFASALAISDLDLDEIEKGSYVDLADRMRQFIRNVRDDHHELFRRMVFNMLVRNEDDHLRNHGFIYQKDGWRLSPAYDIVPTPARARKTDLFHLALHVGTSGSEASPENLLSQCERFSLTGTDAVEIIRETLGIVQDWEKEFILAGASMEDIEAVRWCFEGFARRLGSATGMNIAGYHEPLRRLIAN